MPDSRLTSPPIGVFDSGVGGLSILQALQTQLPEESFIYVADSGFAPYGDRTANFVEERVFEVARFLVAHNAKAMVIACNTASVLTARRLRDRYTLPIVAMEPAIKPATQITQSKVILVLATTSTINSESVARLCQTYGSGIHILLQPCPGLVELIEADEIDSPQTQQLLETFILPGISAGADTVVLGCTHYVFLREQITAITGPSITIVEPSNAIARQLSRVVHPPIPGMQRNAFTEFYTSGSLSRMSTFLASIGMPYQQVQTL